MTKTSVYIKKISADHFTPLIVFKKLQGIALLESAILEMGKSRYSIILVEEAFRIVSNKKGISKITKTNKTLLTKDNSKILEIIKKHQPQVAHHELIPIPGGGIGYLSYETCQYFDQIKLQKQVNSLNVPEAIFSFGSVFAVFDHYRDEINIVVIERSGINGQKKAQEVIQRLQDTDFRAYHSGEDKQYNCEADLNSGKKEFVNGVEKLKKEIIAGNIIQAVLSRTVEVKSDLPALEAYSRLRRENPSPYLFYFDFTDFQLFGSSPEVMAKLDGNTAVIKPIAGTRPRGKTLQEDLAYEKELLTDPKELAEHLMLIDLARNDLGRVSKPGTVTPEAMYGVERYSHVMHIVSEIHSELAEGKNSFDLVAASFPAGTVSGAPKIKAIELLSGIEKNLRGPYAGLVGYFDLNGNFDSCITIRSVLHLNNNYYITSGAGIVYDSIPENEFIETQNKAKAMLKSLGVKI